MAMTPEERRLIHQKGQQPTYGIGVPEDSFGIDGDTSFRKVGTQTIQYLKQDGGWVEVSVSDVDISGIASEEFGDQFIGSQSEFLHWLTRFRSTIRDWGRSWSTTGKFDTDFNSSDDTIINFLQFNTGSDEGAASANRRFIVPRNCILQNINFLIQTPSNTQENTYGFRLKFWGASVDAGVLDFPTEPNHEFPYQNNGTGIHDFAVVVPSGGNWAIINIYLKASLNVSSVYNIGIEQFSFPDSQHVVKGTLWTAYFSNV